jgi:hypothetical protein
MWTDENRARYDRSKLRYPQRPDRPELVSDLAADPIRQAWR